MHGSNSPLERQKVELREKAVQCTAPAKGFEETLRTALDFLGNPCKLCDSERTEHKKAVLRMAFSDQLTYVRDKGFLNPNLALSFKALGQFSDQKGRMVGARGFEPLTPAV